MMEEKKQSNTWMKVNVAVTYVTAVVTLGLIGGQIWLHVKMDDDPNPITNVSDLCPFGHNTTDPMNVKMTELTEQINSLRVAVFGCENPCTHELVRGNNEEPMCVERWRVEVVDSWCSCFCGDGSTRVQEECVWYEGTSAENCQERRSRDMTNHGCGTTQISHSKEIDTNCSNQPCTVNSIGHLTKNHSTAGSESQFCYKVITELGGACDLGELSKDNDRQPGQSENYVLEMPCNACMMSQDETFASVNITISGNDDWDTQHVTVVVNGHMGMYFSSQPLSNNMTLSYAKLDFPIG